MTQSSLLLLEHDTTLSRRVGYFCKSPVIKMPTTGPRVWVRSILQSGRLVPKTAQGLKAQVVVLAPAGVMNWHSTGSREELLIILEGQAQLEIQISPHAIRRVHFRLGRCVFLPSQTTHRIVNRSKAKVRYLYVTGPIA